MNFEVVNSDYLKVYAALNKVLYLLCEATEYLSYIERVSHGSVLLAASF